MKYYLQVLKKYADFNGRARRSEYWYFILFSTIIATILDIATVNSRLKFIYYLYSLLVLIPTIAVAIRRVHDVNKSGWWILFPFYNIVLVCSKGTEGANEYGNDPKNPDYDEDIEQIGNN